MSVPWPDDSLFEPFNIFETTFKEVSSHEIKTAVLIPKNLKPGHHPVIFNFHGGFLATGHSLLSAFFPPWACELALENSAIIVSPNYRLLPTENGVADILEDLEDFWQWSRSSLAKVMEEQAPGHSLDLSKALLTGTSAGGYCCLQLALSHPDEISAVAVLYPLIELYDRLYFEGPAEGEPTILRFPPEDIPSEEASLAWIDDKIKDVTSKAGVERTPFCVGFTQHGYYASVLDPKNLRLDSYLPLERMRAGAKLPPKVWVMHGDDDSVVPSKHSDRFAELVKECQPQTTLRYDVVPGQDHAFDLFPGSWPFKPQAMDSVKDGWLN